MNVDDDAIGVDVTEPARMARRRLLKVGGISLGVLAAGGLCGAPFRSTVSALVGRPRATAPNVAVQIFQTAASLENLAIATYTSVLDLPGVQDHPTIAQFIETTMGHHAEHVAAFNAQAEALGGARQDAPNPRYAQIVEEATPTLTDAAAVVRLFAMLEEVATDTYLSNVTMLEEPSARLLMASVMGVEAQHLAVLRTITALLAADQT